MARRAIHWVGAALALAGGALVARSIELDLLAATWRAALDAPAVVLGALAAYAAAFVVRAALWRRILPDLGVAHALAALHVSLAGNHVLPFRLGEALRVTSVVRRAGVPLPAATASTLTLRAADVLAVAAIAVLLGPSAAVGLLGGWVWPLVAVVAAAGAAGVVWLRRLARHGGPRVRLPDATVAAGACAAWVLESAVVFAAARFAGVDLSPLDAVLVTAVTIVAQTVAVTPGGIGTYEAAATAALVALGAPTAPALAAAVTAHALKTGYALATGAVATAAPAPGLLGRLRLPQRGDRPSPSPPRPHGPVVLFLPAHDEAATVGAVLQRAPSAVLGRPVVRLVVDDGSRDGTAAAARAAGARVLCFEANRGLGAAVRRGLAEAVACGAAAVAFCDADGEYAPEELERLVAPVLGGEADYVVGSRFAGDTRRMLPHRRLGNVALTRLLAFAARERISDGQSGYRCLSGAAAADAEIVHDYNYAQVLTLDLLGKGYRYAEVPIGYGFRRTGRSFVCLGRYLRAVLPAVYRELNPPAGATAGARRSAPTAVAKA